MKTDKQIAAAAAEFAKRWKDRGYERGESQPYWIDLLSNVLGIVVIKGWSLDPIETEVVLAFEG